MPGLIQSRLQFNFYPNCPASGDFVEITGRRKTVAKCFPTSNIQKMWEKEAIGVT